MVSYPKKRRTFCKKCKKHAVMTVSQYKAGKASPVAQGARRYKRKQAGFGGQTKPIFHKKTKTTKKVTIKLKCSVCARNHQLVLKRAKTFILMTDSQRKEKASTPSY